MKEALPESPEIGKCVNCRFAGFGVNPDIAIFSYRDPNRGAAGFCYRNPNQLQIETTHGCGEFQPNKAERERREVELARVRVEMDAIEDAIFREYRVKRGDQP